MPDRPTVPPPANRADRPVVVTDDRTAGAADGRIPPPPRAADPGG
ncbi:hypothetical protein [Actinomycetospora sp. TBRC 11914]|nr:hypothetical protein [Actinomycetospora sp. TBRC 11914]